MTQISKNVFSKGLSRDYDPANISAYSMVDNINGRIMFNERGTLDWVEDNGNRFSFSIEANGGTDPSSYRPIGYCGDGNIKVLFLVRADGLASEIGLVGTDDDGVGTYRTMFNDLGSIEKLEFKITNQIEARFVYENDNIIRAYWVDGVKEDSNRPRVYTFSFDNTLGVPRNDVSAYFPVTTSVHSMNSQADHLPGIIKFKRTIGGTLLSGVYQYTYRLLTNDGYASPWITPTRKYHMTTDLINNSNWNRYEMEGSGIVTNKGNRLEMRAVDTRFDKIQVAYIHSEVNSEIREAAIFVEQPIDSFDIEIDHVAMGGEPLTAAEIAQLFQGIAKAKTLNIKDSTLYYGNLVELSSNFTDAEIEDVLANLDIRPKFRLMASDEFSIGYYETTDTIVGGGPIVHATSKTGITQRAMFTGTVEDYEINSDYINYKGTQVENMYTGYFRGETYRFALVLFDLIGNPSFAYHLADFKFPAMYETDYSWKRLDTSGAIINGSGSMTHEAWQTNDYGSTDLQADPILSTTNPLDPDISQLRVMGVEFDGIDVSGIKDKISGFSIVRCNRDGEILQQGLLFPTTFDYDDNTRTRPHPVSHQRFGIFPGAPDPSNPQLLGVNTENKGGNGDFKYRIRPNLSSFYCPDQFFDPASVPTVQSQDRLRIAGSCYKEPDLSIYGSGDGNNNAHKLSGIAFLGPHYESTTVLCKWYRSRNQFHQSGSSSYIPNYGDQTLIDFDFTIGVGEEFNYESNLEFHNSVGFDVGGDNPDGMSFSLGIDGDSYFSWGKAHQVYKHSNYYEQIRAGVTASNANSSAFAHTATGSDLGVSVQAGVLIGNYVRLNPTPYGGLSESSLERTIYYSTGHFQPVNNPNFPQSGTDIYDGIEVYGGDCYLDYFSFLRLYGRWDFAADSGEDFHLGHSFPLESTINHSMRQVASEQNPMFADIGIKIKDGSGGNPWTNGLRENGSDTLREEFNYNDVLTFAELIYFYSSEPVGFNPTSNYPTRWRNTLDKFYGNRIDTWRQFEINALDDLNGQHGAITSSTYLFNQIYSYQETAFGRLRAFDRAALESETTQSLTTGIGPALDGIDYVSTTCGNQHQWSLVNSGKAAYWIDVFKGKAMRFAGNGLEYLSDIKGLHNYFQKETKFFDGNDNPANNNGIWGTWDEKNRDVLFTWSRDIYTEIRLDTYIRSDVSSLDNYYANNETVFVNFTGTAGNGLILPVGANPNGVNDNVLQYVSLNSASSPMAVKQDVGGTITTLVTINPGEFYLFFRANGTDTWQFTLVEEKNITPYRSTIVYSEYVSAFTQFHSFNPNFYIAHNNQLLSISDDILINDFYIHGRNDVPSTYYGRKMKTSLTVTVNDKSEFAKIFDNVRVATNNIGVDTLNRFIFNSEQQKNYYDITPDTRNRFLEDILRLPIRTFDQTDRMRGRWLAMNLEFINESNFLSKIDNFINHYRVSNRR